MSHSIRCSASAVEFSMGNYPAAAYLYGCLDAQQFNAGPSGNGEAKTYTREGIINARRKLQYMKGEDWTQWHQEDKAGLGEVAAVVQSLFPGGIIVRRRRIDPAQEWKRIADFLDEIIESGEQIIEIHFG